SSSSSLESLSNTSSTGVHSLQSSNLFSSQTRSTSLSSYTRQISDTPTRLSTTNSLSSSKLEPVSGSSSAVRSIRTPHSTNLPPKPQTRGLTLYQCRADNDSELSFNANEIVTQGNI
ncbi:unnamed protein product, partial [Rotaria magnacalcarata]